jgi:hypothetical protein
MGKRPGRPVLHVSFAPQHLLRTEISRGWLDPDSPFSPLQVPLCLRALVSRVAAASLFLRFSCET